MANDKQRSQKSQWWKKGLFLGAVIFVPALLDAQQQARPQQAPAPEQIDPALEATVLTKQAEQIVKDILKPALKEEPFSVSVLLEPIERVSTPLPYLPGSNSQLLPLVNDGKSLKSVTKKLKVRILLPRRIDAAGRRGLAQLVTEGFGLDTGRGDGVDLADLPVEVTPFAAEREAAAARAEASVREAQRQVEVLKKERDDASRDLAAAKSKLETAERKVQTHEEGMAKEAPTARTQLASYGALAGALILGVLLLGFLLIRAAIGMGSRFQSGLETVGRGIETLSRRGDADRAGPPFEPVQALPSAAATAGMGDQGTGPRQMQDAYQSFMALKAEILPLYNQGGEQAATVILDYLVRMLADPATAERGVSALELFDKPTANRLYEQLGTSAQEQILRFLGDLRYSMPKANILVIVAEEIKTILLTSELPQRHGQLDGRVRVQLLRLTDSALADFMQTLDEGLAARMFAYLTPQQTARLLDNLATAKPNAFDKIATALSALPTGGSATTADERLARTLSGFVERSEGDLEKVYLPHYLRVADQVDDKAREMFVKVLGRANPKIGRIVSEQVITFATFFEISEDYRIDIIDRLELSEIAALLAFLPSGQVAVISNAVGSQRLEIVQDDVRRMEGLKQRERDQRFNDARKKVVAAMRQLKGNGALSDLMPKPKNERLAA